MTAIISVLNSQGIAIAADSAATVSSGNVKKVYNKSNKLFALSKYHPVGIAVYNNLLFEGIPWETLIKMYRKQLKEKKFDTVEKYKDDFINFLYKNLKLITPQANENNFYSFCITILNEIKTKFTKSLDENIDKTKGMSDVDSIKHISPILSQDLNDYKNYIDPLPKSNLIKFTLVDFTKEHDKHLIEVIADLKNHIISKYPTFAFSADDEKIIKEIFFEATKIAHIFESNNSGLVFMGFGDKEVYPTSQLVTIGSVVNDTIRHKMEPEVNISPGTRDANIIPYAQNDVTMTVLTGIDPTYQNEINSAITEAFKTVSSEVKPKISTPDEAQKTSEVIEGISKTLIDKLDTYRNEIITRPLLNVLNNMGKEDMAEMAESLVNITSLKRKFTQNSSDESVGGPVDVAIITKGDGFIWVKRKHYFDINLNQRFKED